MRPLVLITFLIVATTKVLFSQNEPVVVEADTAIPGADFSVITEGVVTFITPQTNFIDANFPGSMDKVVTFTLNFPDTGTYDLFARVRVGNENYNDDSYFIANSFGEKSPIDNTDWSVVNGIVEIGYADPEDVVTGGGNAGMLTWKWMNVSEYLGGHTPLTFTVGSTDSVYTFMYGAREDGLDLDKIAFGKSWLYYTVNNLENGEAGSDTLPGSIWYPDSAELLVKTYINPVLPGDHPDPTLLKVENDFYHCGSSFHFTPYLPILHSTDLVHWNEIARVISPDWSGLSDDGPSHGIWQGAITRFYDSWWIYFSNTAGGGQYFCKADYPEGPWSDPVKVITTAETGASGYDNSVFVDDDGTPYMLIKPGQYVNRIQEIGTDGHLTGSVINLDWVNAEGQYSWAEGPVMCKKDGWYYYFIAGNVAGGQYVLRSNTLTDDPDHWEAMGSVFPSPSDPDATLRSPNHMTQPFQLDDGTWWSIVHSYEHVNGDDWSGQGRQGILHQITWNEDGKPTGTTPTSLPLLKPNLPKSGIPWKLSRSDYFDQEILNLSWHFLNTSAASKYSLTERPGWIRINPGSSRSHILHKDGGHYYTLVTRVDIDAHEDDQAAGIYLTNGNESVYIRLYSGYNGGKKIIFTFGNISYEAVNDLGNTIWLKLDRKEHDLYAYYSINGLVWILIGESISAVNLDRSQPDYNSWVGNSHGLFAEGIQADFDLFLYKDGFSELSVAGYNNYFGIETISSQAGKVVTNSVAGGGWLMLGGVELGEGEKVPLSVEVTASSISGGIVEIWLDDLLREGTKIATLDITSTGSTDSFEAFTADVSGISGQHDVYLRFQGEENAANMSTIRFIPDDRFFTGIEIENSNIHRVQIYPNPFKDYLTIDLIEEQGYYIIYDLSGIIVKSGEIINRQEIVTNNLSSGMYIIKINIEDKTISTKINKQ